MSSPRSATKLWFVGVVGLLLSATLNITPFQLHKYAEPSAQSTQELTAHPQQNTPALVSAEDGLVPLGGVEVTLPVRVRNVADLGAVTAEIGYDNTVT
ncbi:MAG: hypothetical protein KDD84_20220, partial [Caldilineaceae bacterium]|nr:hypothetical protein [Caldilineaceae bacterium]